MLPYVIGAVLGLVLGAALVYVFGVLRERKQADEDLNSAKNQAKQIVNDARGPSGVEGGDPQGPQ